MFGNIVIVLLVSVVGAWALSAPEYQLERLEEYFEDFKREYNKVYPNEHEESKRLEIFKQNLIEANEKNKMRVNDVDAVFGITKFSDLTAEEFKKMYTGLRTDMMPKIKGNIFKPSGDFVPPKSFDWRTQNKVTRVKNQGGCGSCYAFSAVGCLESQYAIKYNKLIDFSEQQVVDCVNTCDGCDGGWQELVYDQLIEDGLELESDYPYVALQNTCKLDKSKTALQVSGYTFIINGTEDVLKEALVKKGPLAIAVDSTTWHGYKKGIHYSCKFKGFTHGVLLVGYGEEQGSPYWIVKNSWGNWGENGYIRIQYGVDACGLTKHVLFGDIK